MRARTACVCAARCMLPQPTVPCVRPQCDGSSSDESRVYCATEDLSDRTDWHSRTAVVSAVLHSSPPVAAVQHVEDRTRHPIRCCEPQCRKFPLAVAVGASSGPVRFDSIVEGSARALCDDEVGVRLQRNNWTLQPTRHCSLTQGTVSSRYCCWPVEVVYSTDSATAIGAGPVSRTVLTSTYRRSLGRRWVPRCQGRIGPSGCGAAAALPAKIAACQQECHAMWYVAPCVVVCCSGRLRAMLHQPVAHRTRDSILRTAARA
jgi:hypothetical protein